MTPQTTQKMNQKIGPPYLVTSKYGGLRVAVLAYQHLSGGICFLDIGWDKAGSNPFHVLDGPFEVKQTPSGVVYNNNIGGSVRSLLEQDPQWDSWAAWQEYLESPDGVGVDQQEAVDGCASNGALVDQAL